MRSDGLYHIFFLFFHIFFFFRLFKKNWNTLGCTSRLNFRGEMLLLSLRKCPLIRRSAPPRAASRALTSASSFTSSLNAKKCWISSTFERSLAPHNYFTNEADMVVNRMRCSDRQSSSLPQRADFPDVCVKMDQMRRRVVIPTNLTCFICLCLSKQFWTI